jgi:outer membrane receptor protein involved in Fe transport
MNQKLHVFSRPRLLSVAVAAFSLANAPGALAQQLEEVVVTAQKRAESLQDVPISVSAMDAEKISSAGIQRFEDMTAFVPNFSVTRDPIGDKINIRGIQSGNQAGFEQSVGTFVDGIYRGRGTQARFAFLDVEMVEILRGPQGTLFGKNTIAGALNIRSAKPTEEFSGQISAAYNVDFEESEFQGHVSGPLTDNLRGRLYAMNRSMDKGWVYNSFYDHDVSQTDENAIRLSLEWDLGEATTVSFKTEYADFEVIGQPWETIKAGPLAAFGVEENIDYRTNMGARDSVLDFGSNGDIEGETQETVLTVQHDLSNGSQLTAIAGYSAYDFQRFLDADFAPIDAVRFDDSEDFEQTSFEVRLASDTGGAFEYITGFFYQQQDMIVDGLTYFNIAALQPILQGGCEANLGALSGGALGYADVAAAGDAFATGANVANAIGEGGGFGAAVANACAQAAAFDPVLNAAGLNGVSRYARLEQETETMAVFFQGTWNINDDLALTVGLRYTEEEKTADQSVHAADYIERNTAPTTNPVAIAAGQAVGEFTTHSFTSSDPGLSRDEESLTWSANLQWHVNDDVMVYASASTGFKSGGFNSFYMGRTQGLGANSEDAAFEEEEVISFEIGSKMTVLDGRGEINTAIFRTEFDDLQASVFTGGTTFVVQNAAEAVSQGIEIDSRWALSDAMTLTASAGYIDFEFESFPNQACTAEQFVAARQAAYAAALAAQGAAAAGAQSLLYNNAACSAAGVNDLAGGVSENTPELQATLGLNYAQEIGADYLLNANLDINWRDEVYRQGDLDPFALIDPVTKVNLTLALSPVAENWELAVIAKNLTDEEDVSYVNDTPLFNGARQNMTDAPRSITLRGIYRFD